jgi:hypothetical protein
MAIKKLSELQKVIEFDQVTKIVNKLKAMINGKADSEHTHSPNDIDETTEKKFVSDTEKNKIAAISISGDGTNFLSDDGNYKPANSSVLITDGDGKKFLANDGVYKPTAMIDDVNASINSTYSSTKIEEKLGTKVNAKDWHTHNNKDIIDDITLEKVTGWDTNTNIVKSDGDGQSYLANDGTYKPIDISATIDDINIATTSTYSSTKIEEKLGFKVDVDNWHDHANKDLLDDITLERFTEWDVKTALVKSDGDGQSFLTNDGTYKSIAGISNPIDDSNETSVDTTLSASKINQNIETAVSDLEFDVTQKLNGKVDAEIGKGLSENNFTTIEKNKLDLIKTDGSPKEFFARDGSYYEINNVGINDKSPTNITSYSGSYIEKRINDGILNLVLPTQNDAPTMWKKNFQNVTAGDVLELQTSFNFNINNAIIQVYKFIAGETGLTKVISNFTTSETQNYIYNPDNVEFSGLNDGQVKIKDSYAIPLSVNEDGFYETQLISKSDYNDIDSFSVIVR